MQVGALIVSYKREHLTAWGNFRDHTCHQCYLSYPSIPLICSLRRAGLILLYFYTGLLPFVKLRERCFEVMMPSILLKYVLTCMRRCVPHLHAATSMRSYPHAHITPTPNQRRLIRLFDV